MHAIPLTPELVAGAVSVEETETYLQPWRLPHTEAWQFISPAETLLQTMAHTSGVRLRFRTDATALKLTLSPLSAVRQDLAFRQGPAFDMTDAQGDLLESQVGHEGDTEVVFSELPGELQTLELWLPQDAPTQLRGLEIEEGASLAPVADERPRWLTYGSSLTHCVRAFSPARTWPAIVARRHGLNLTSLGYGGNCQMESRLGMMIRDLPADLITLKLGINCINGALNGRTFAPAVMGLICLIRERHPTTPITVISPIAYPPNETEPNRVDMTIGKMREAIEEVVCRFQDHGDPSIAYVNGLKVFSLEEIAQHSKDQCHPGAEGIELQAENFDREVMQPLLKRAGVGR